MKRQQGISNTDLVVNLSIPNFHYDYFVVFDFLVRRRDRTPVTDLDARNREVKNNALIVGNDLMDGFGEPRERAMGRFDPVSYTHLTLPTICSV